jgi:hypothetical protein
MDEVDEARLITDEVAVQLRALGVEVKVFHDNTSTSQSTNLTTIVNAHNGWGPHDWDISVHMNAYNGTAHGVETLYVSNAGKEMAQKISGAICTASGLTLRGDAGAVYRSDLKFLNSTLEPACLIEAGFCDNPDDCGKLSSAFASTCSAIAGAIAGRQPAPGPDPGPDPGPPAGVLFSTSGRVSYFGGPSDTGVSPSEQLAFITDEMQAPQLFLPYQPDGTTGLARRLNPWTPYCAARWDYEDTPKSMLRDSGQLARVTNPRTGNFIDCWPADWGPHSDTNRVMDLSPLVMTVLDLTTDSEAELVYPAPD